MKQTKTNSPTNSGSTSIPPIGSAFLYIIKQVEIIQVMKKFSCVLKEQILFKLLLLNFIIKVLKFN